jgi:adenylosuccinate synthase
MAERKIIILLSGEISAGKSTLSKKLEEKFNFKVLRTREAIEELRKKHVKGNPGDRTFLQEGGAALDKIDEGKWVLDFFQQQFKLSSEDDRLFVIDSVRIASQIKHFRKAYGHIVFHIHLLASPEKLKERFMQREEVASLEAYEAEQKYEQSKRDLTEMQVDSLAADADLCINTERSTPEDVVVRIASFLKLLAPTGGKLVDVLVGGQFGSEGKGQISAHISPEYDCLLRVGGPNAGHTVYEEPEKHVFHHLPSGCYRNQHAKLLLGPGTVINVDKLMEEIAKYNVVDEFSKRLVIDENAIIISEKDIELEKENQTKISSTAQGVGAATATNILARLWAETKHKAKNHPKLKPFIGSTFNELEDMYRNNKKILLEGTQGTGLSLHHGLYPYVTSRDTTVSGCISEAGISPMRINKIIMVTRTYPIRVGGTSGDFQSNEIDFDIIAQRSGLDPHLLKKREITTTTKKERRIAEFNWSLFRKACELNSPTDIALTFVDYFSKDNEKARRYDQLTQETKQFIEEIERCSGVKVSLISTGFDYRAIIDRRNW